MPSIDGKTWQKTTFGENIRSLRETKGYTVPDFSEQVGLTAEELLELENGTFPSFTVIFSIADVLEVSCVELFHGDQYESTMRKLMELCTREDLEELDLFTRVFGADGAVSHFILKQALLGPKSENELTGK
jgi:transcriptional regulator with XRE-family HTH domain